MPQTAQQDNGRQLPSGDEIFLDHVAHFVRDREAAHHAMARAGFTTTPVSIQVNSDASGTAVPTGLGNVTAMLSRGYIEVLFKTADTALSGELDDALAHHAGVHLAAFTVADAQKAHARLGEEGFLVRELAHMRRPVATETGAATAAFTVARVEPGVMPEGRIQFLTHHTEETVWQKRWLAHPNGSTGLIDVVIAVADVEEAARRYSRFTGREAKRTPGGAMLRLDRGGIYLVSHERVTERLPEVPIVKLPFMAGYALRVQSLAAAETIAESADLDWRALEGSDGIVVRFPSELGEGAWFFVERASALPWRR